MSPPRVRAMLERRILVNYRIEPDALETVVPAPFRPVLIDGHGIAGICLIRLGRIRPAGFPAAWLSSENAAHRIAVERDTPAGPATCVYIPRRDTSSWLTVLAGGRMFPGWHHPARFSVSESGSQFLVQLRSRDGSVRVRVDACRSDRVMVGSVFQSVAEADQFFRSAPIGYSATPAADRFDGVELGCSGWNLEPRQVREVASSFFDDVTRFPPGTVTLDSAFLMRGLETTWHPLPGLRGETAQVRGPARMPLVS